MAEACCSKTAEALAAKQGRVLRIVLALNLVMFLVEAGAGLVSRSSALLGDSLDMLGDALAYGATLYVLHRSPAWKARATVLKGTLMALTAATVLVAAITRAILGEVPTGEVISGFGALALIVNASCLALLMKHRTDDMNLSSAWTCSRNDLIANVAVIVAGGLVLVSSSLWPDLVVGVGIALLFARSAARVLRDARSARHPRGPQPTSA